MAETEQWPEMFPLPFSGASPDGEGGTQGDPRLDEILSLLRQLAEGGGGSAGSGNADAEPEEPRRRRGGFVRLRGLSNIGQRPWDTRRQQAEADAEETEATSGSGQANGDGNGSLEELKAMIEQLPQRIAEALRVN